MQTYQGIALTFKFVFILIAFVFTTGFINFFEKSEIILPYESLKLSVERGENNTAVFECNLEHSDDVKNINKLVQASNSYLKSYPPRKDIAKCVIQSLKNYSEKANHLNNQSLLQKSLKLSALSSSYIQVNESSQFLSEDKDIFKNYIKSASEQIVNSSKNSQSFYDLYWAAWSVALSSAILNDSNLYKWSMEITLDAINEISDNGVLKGALDKNSDAYYFSLKAIQPLVMLSDFFEKNGEILFFSNNKALVRVGELLISDYPEGLKFRDLTFSEQNLSKVDKNSDFSWVIIFSKYRSSNEVDSLISENSFFNPYVGGDLSYIYAQR